MRKATKLSKGKWYGASFTAAFVLIFASENAMAAHPQETSFSFHLSLSKEQLSKKQASIDITVPSNYRRFEAPKWYGGAPNFLKFVSDISATDSAGRRLSTKIKDNIVEVAATKSASFTLHYSYNIPQSISGQLDFALPVLNESYARFDNNLTFLEPKGAAMQAAKLSISAPSGWEFQTGWGADREISIQHLSDLISGMIVMGHYDYSRAKVGNSQVVFAIIGDYSHETIKSEFCKVLQSQQEIAGDLPSQHLLVAFIPTSMDSCKGTSLSNALSVCIPLKEKLTPFNFAVIGTTSHELFHQWNLRYARPKSDKGVYLLTEGFTNHFAITALARAGLISEERFGRHLCRYRKLLTDNPKYPSDYATIQAGLEKDANLFDLCYTKGPFVALLLDLALREDTGNKESLASWFRTLCQKFGGSSGYEVADLRALVAKVSGKQDGLAVKTFDTAFLGGKALDLDELFSKLGITCDSERNCHLLDLSKDAANIRTKVFKAEN
ncbi:MAG: hypothetical protein K2X81_21265 [Candidatus Obscuribacterales bacterium]|nr:hypothetical protein [Candidatus Obscuribacterales bacterium]